MQPWQFFNLETDPYELHNQIDDPEVQLLIRECHGHLRQRMIDTGDEGWLGEAWGYSELNPWPVPVYR